MKPRTSQEIREEIERRFGLFPPFFSPAQESSEVLENLWQQTLSSYVENPIPAAFKEKLFAYLSRFCAVPYCIISHSCALRPLGMSPRRILDWLESPPPREGDIEKVLHLFHKTPGPMGPWPEGNTDLSRDLLTCSIFIFTQKTSLEPLRKEMKRILGPKFYNHLMMFLSYIRTCFSWVESHPELSFEADKRAQKYLPELLREEPFLEDFFRTYPARIQKEKKDREKELLLAQNKIQRSMNESEAQKTAMIEMALDGIIGLNHMGKITEFNPAAEKIFGYQREEIIGRELAETLVPPSLRQAHRQALFRYISKGTSTLLGKRVEMMGLKKDGTEFPVEVTVMSITTQGAPVFTGFIRDITERRRATEALQKSEANYLDLYDNAPVIFASLDPYKATILQCNQTMMETLNLSREELTNRSLYDLFPFEHHEKIRENLKTVIQTGQVENLELSLKGKNGNLDLLINISSIKDEKGNVLYGRSVWKDITHRKQYEENLSHQHQWLQFILDLMPLPLLLMDPQKASITFANKAADTWEGGPIFRGIVTSLTHANHYCTDLNGNKIPVDKWPMVRACRGERLEGDQFVWHSPAGGKYYLMAFSETLPPMFGRPATVVMTFQDIGLLKNYENELEKAVRVRDDFLSLASHELRTPLTPLLLNLQFLQVLFQQGKLNQISRDQLKKILDTTDRQLEKLNRLVNNLAQVSHLNTGEINLNLEEFDLVELLQDVVNRFNGEIPNGQGKMELDGPASLKGRWDRNQMDLLLCHLMGNALKYGLGNPIRINLRHDDITIRLTVQDQGIGISKDHIPRIYECFERAVSSSHYPGLGLGLFIGRKIVQAHGGEISVETSPGKGTLFTVELPLRSREEPT